MDPSAPPTHWLFFDGKAELRRQISKIERQDFWDPPLPEPRRHRYSEATVGRVQLALVRAFEDDRPNMTKAAYRQLVGGNIPIPEASWRAAWREAVAAYPENAARGGLEKPASNIQNLSLIKQCTQRAWRYSAVRCHLDFFLAGRARPYRKGRTMVSEDGVHDARSENRTAGLRPPPGAFGLLETKEGLLTCCAPSTIIGIVEVCALTGLSQWTIMRKMHDGSFPSNRDASDKRAGWRFGVVKAWMEDPR